MAKWTELKRYVDRNGWELYRTTDHWYYRKPVNGRYMYTKVSFGSGEIPPNVFKRILTRQLGITMEQFNADSEPS